MKSTTFRPNHKAKEQTTNYLADTHKEFCKRCLAKHRGKCPDKDPESCKL